MSEAAAGEVRLHESWRTPLREEFASPYMASLRSFLVAEKAKGKRVFPKGGEWFAALDLTPLDKVRVVILGQDPYHGLGQAHGLCFSVRHGTRIPPSLVNIYKEIQSDLGLKPPRHGFLEHWAKQGVLLLNAVLTVEMGQAASHRERGWEKFTDAVVRLVAARPDPVVFMLWGSYAQKKAGFVRYRRAGRPPSGAQGSASLPRFRRIAASSAAAISPKPMQFLVSPRPAAGRLGVAGIMRDARTKHPLPGGERAGVRGLGVDREFSDSEPPHPTLSPTGRGLVRQR
jgi:uracil-DNA glycosylase